MTMHPTGYVATIRQGLLNWLESVRHPDAGWGRWQYNAAMTRPWALNASGLAVEVLDRLDALGSVTDAQKAEAIAFFQSCQDPADLLFKDPLETEATHRGDHSWPQIWGQRNGASVKALGILGAQPALGTPAAQFTDLRAIDVPAWTRAFDWRNPWMHGETWYRAIDAYLSRASDHRVEAHPVLQQTFAVIEAELLDPVTGTPAKLGCTDPSVAMAGLFKIMFGYLLVGRPVPHAERAIDSTLRLQHANGEFGSSRNMCLNWDALWVLRELDKQLQGGYRHADIVAAGERTCAILLAEYRQADGGFAFHGDHCMTNHHSVQLCEQPLPIGDMLGAIMCLSCFEYVDEWHRADHPCPAPNPA